MTIHKSKGLGFDAVLLPDLQFGGITSSGQLDLGVSRQGGINARANWVFSMPIRAIANADPVLSNYVTRMDNDHCYEELCLLYVAITRAKRCLYMIITEQPKNTTTLCYSNLIEKALSGQQSENEISPSVAKSIYQAGHSQWYVPFSAPCDPIPYISTTKPILRRPSDSQFNQESIRHINPSGLEKRIISAGLLFSLSNRESAGVGTAVHSLLEQVEWINSMDLKELLKDWHDASDFRPQIKSKAMAEFRLAMEDSNIRKLFRKPNKQAELWREKRFEIILDKHLVSGSFDRVVLLKTRTQQIESASIIDFKTDRVEANSDHSRHLAIYKPQLDLYRRVLSVMIKLPESKITCKLAFTKTNHVLEI